MNCGERISGAVRRSRGIASLPAAAALALMLLAPAADAADLSDAVLRGAFWNPPAAQPYGRWDGINIGAFAGVTNMDTDFGGSTGQLVAFILRNSTLENEASPSSWTALPHNITNGRSYGLFLGYNVQWEQLVLGVDATYTRASSVNASANDSISRIVTTSDGVQHDVTIAAQSTMTLIDYATLRMRAGYAFGQFLPYGFIGGAVGRFNYTSSATVTSLETPPAPAVPYTFGPVTQSSNKDNAIVGGFTFGLGVDVALLPNVFLRGEWEFVGFAPTNGIRSAINSGRVGLGMKF